MTVGHPNVFAIESGILIAYERLSHRALGHFLIHVGGKCYGVFEADATMMAVSVDEVDRRIARRGKHVAAFAAEGDAGEIAHAFRNAIYAEVQDDSFLGLTLKEFCKVLGTSHFRWAPDGDEAFDDGSYVFQFDVGERVRLIAFKSLEDDFDRATLTDAWLPADEFYGVLQKWRKFFDEERACKLKILGGG